MLRILVQLANMGHDKDGGLSTLDVFSPPSSTSPSCFNLTLFLMHYVNLIGS
jgi:hypothetical protein